MGNRVNKDYSDRILTIPLNIDAFRVKGVSIHYHVQLPVNIRINRIEMYFVDEFDNVVSFNNGSCAVEIV